MCNNTITNEKLKKLSCLTSLSLRENDTITDAGIKALFRLTTFPCGRFVL
jgi:hypothetical protein